MELEFATVTSELYSEKNYITTSKPIHNQNNVVSKFAFKLPPSTPKLDSDGDIIVDRKRNNIKYIEIEHSNSTILDLVGLQIWRGALLLADWLIYKGDSFFKDETILEVGSGVGLSSIVAAMYAPVICTDIDKGGILELIRNNVKRNKVFTKYSVKTLGLDFTLPFTKEIEALLSNVTTVIAADVIYDDSITESFVNTLFKLLEKPPSKTIYIALEKRYVFTIEDLNSGAPCYEYFLELLEKLKFIKDVKFEEISIDFPQYFEYERVKQLVLWKITSKFK